MIKSKTENYKIPSFEEQLADVLKAGKEGKLIKWDGTNLGKEQSQ